MSIPASSFSRETNAGTGRRGIVSSSRRMPSTRSRTRPPPAPGSTWMSLACAAIARANTSSTARTAGASAVARRASRRRRRVRRTRRAGSRGSRRAPSAAAARAAASPRAARRATAASLGIGERDGEHAVGDGSAAARRTETRSRAERAPRLPDSVRTSPCDTNRKHRRAKERQHFAASLNCLKAYDAGNTVDERPAVTRDVPSADSTDAEHDTA